VRARVSHQERHKSKRTWSRLFQYGRQGITGNAGRNCWTVLRL